MILRVADQAGHKMEANMQHHPHQIVNIKFAAMEALQGQHRA